MATIKKKIKKCMFSKHKDKGFNRLTLKIKKMASGCRPPDPEKIDYRFTFKYKAHHPWDSERGVEEERGYAEEIVQEEDFVEQD